MIREFHLSPTGEGLGISCDGKGAFIGAIPILKKLRKNGRDEWDLRDCEQLSEEISEHYGLPIDMSSKSGGLKVIANALNEGDVARAQIGAVLLGIPDSLSLTKGVPSHDQMIKLIGDLHWSGLLNWGPDGVLEKAGYNPDEPRDQRGRWTNEGDATVEANVAGRDPRTQLADLGISDASDDPIADAARTAARIDSDHKTSDGDNAPNMVLAAAESEDEKEPRSANELIPQRLQRSPAGPAVEFLDNLLDISGPGDEANLEMGQLLMDNLLHEIRKIDPNYVDSSIWPPGELAGMTWQERQSVISRYQAVLAAKIYGARGDIRPLQEVTLDFMQRTANTAYTDAVEQYRVGNLTVRLSPEVAIGNYVDRTVRSELRDFYSHLGIAIGPTSAIQVNARAYKSVLSYRIPDAYVGNLVFEVSLTAKSLSDSQITDFFNARLKPIGVVIVRPNQLGNDSSYVIWRPRGW